MVCQLSLFKLVDDIVTVFSEHTFESWHYCSHLDDLFDELLDGFDDFVVGGARHDGWLDLVLVENEEDTEKSDDFL